MAKMNWEHRTRMEKVKQYPPTPTKKRKRKPTKKHGNKIEMHARFNGFCAICTRPYLEGAKIWYDHTKNPGKKVVHFFCWEPK